MNAPCEFCRDIDKRHDGISEFKQSLVNRSQNGLIKVLNSSIETRIGNVHAQVSDVSLQISQKVDQVLKLYQLYKNQKAAIRSDWTKGNCRASSSW